MYITIFTAQTNIEGDMSMIRANIIAYILVLCGALNWGLVGIFNWNLVEAIFGGFNAGSIIIYILVFIAGIWLLISPWLTKGKFILCNKQDYTKYE